jgi:CpXC protein
VSGTVDVAARCPDCGVEQRAHVFDSLNADLLGEQLDLIADGRFEELACVGCARLFRPEHRLLLVQMSRRAWIVMHPLADRPRFAALESAVEQLLAQRFAEAPPVVATQLHQVRPRLVFGQHMLTDAVSSLRAELDPALLECAKLLLFRRELSRFFAHGPCELGLEGVDDGGALRLGLYALADGRRLDAMTLPRADLATAAELRALLQPAQAALLERPYVASARLLYDAE